MWICVCVCVCVCSVACARSYVYVTRACCIICVCAKILQDFNSHSATHSQTRNPDAVPNNFIPTSSSVTTFSPPACGNPQPNAEIRTKHAALCHHPPLPSPRAPRPARSRRTKGLVQAKAALWLLPQHPLQQCARGRAALQVNSE